MKKFTKVLPILMTLGICTSTVFANASATTTIANATYSSTSTAISTGTVPISPIISIEDFYLSTQYPELNEYIVKLDKSVEVGELKVTINEILLVHNQVLLSITTEKLDGSAFENYSNFSHISLNITPSAEEEFAELILKLANTVYEELPEVLTDSEVALLSEYFYQSSSHISSSQLTNSITSEDGTKLLHSLNSCYYTLSDSLAGSDFTLSLSDLGYIAEDEKTLDINLVELHEQSKDIPLITSEVIYGVSNVSSMLEVGLGYEISEAITLENVKTYINEDGENVLSISTKYDPSHYGTYHSIEAQFKDGTTPVRYSDWSSQSLHGIDFLLGDYTLEDVELILTTYDYIILNDDIIEIDFTLPIIATPTISAQPDLNLQHSSGVTINVEAITVTPLKIEILGSHTQNDLLNSSGFKIDTVELYYHNGSRAPLALSQTTYSRDNGLTQFNISYDYEDSLINVNDISSIIINGMPVEF
ncbi:MAG: hypothetical protein BEN19_04395 [Epulopiscium sp. Nuni2H_MBin003]|nr:MAG: hypothetical protein BEN19_04395 [Epulopiscium sp. Nuni2H_MBin003]